MSQPPSVGPSAGARVAVRPKMEMPIGCCARGSRVRRIVTAVGISTPPQKPWPHRLSTSAARLSERAQHTENTRNKAELASR